MLKLKRTKKVLKLIISIYMIKNFNEKDLNLLYSHNINYILYLFNIIKGDMNFVGPMPLDYNQVNNINKK